MFRSELDCYLEDEMVDVHIKGFDILDWWKVEEHAILLWEWLQGIFLQFL